MPNAKRLTSIYIYSRDVAGNYTELKHFDLEQSYFACQDGYTQSDQNVTASHPSSYLLKRLRLDKVTEKSGTASIPAYQLAYYESATLKLPIYGSYAQDFWGFYNGVTSNQKLLYLDTNGSASPSNSYGANRNTNFTYTILGTIKSVTYPTGGRSEFEFEPHATGTTPADQGGGIRIKSITNYEGTTLLTKKTYSYPGAYITNNIFSGNMSGFGSAFTSRSSEYNDICSIDQYERSFYPEGYQFMIGSNSGSSMEYNLVDEISVDGSSNPLGKTTRKFKQATDATNSLFPFKTVRNGWMRGQLEEEKTYNAANQLVSQILNAYKTVATDSVVRNIGSKPRVTPAMGSGNGCIQVVLPLYCPGEFTASTQHSWWSSPVDYTIAAIFLESSTKTTYGESGTDGVEEKTEYVYATATNHQIKEKKLTNSQNKIELTSYKYPHDLAASSTDYSEMVTRHIYTPVIEEEYKYDGTVARVTKTNFKKWFASTPYNGVSGFFAPLSIEVKLNSGPSVKQITFGEKHQNPTVDGYDNKAHVVIYTDRDSTVNRFTWWQEKGKLDLVNTHSVNALFPTTYDYKPLSGVRSITDPSGKATFYHYDSFNRLSDIRNDSESGPVIRSFCYNYAGQTVACDAVVATGAILPGLLELITPPPLPLPVNLINFNAVKEERTALLSWNTTEETNSERFDIEHSLDGKKWTRIGSVDAKGESAATLYYSFRDSSPANGENLYRLKMVDRDGSFANSRIQGLNFDSQVSVYPNPVGIGQKLTLDVADPATVSQVKIYDVAGKVVYSSGKPEREIDVNALQPGVYVVQIAGTNGAVSIHRIVKQ